MTSSAPAPPISSAGRRGRMPCRPCCPVSSLEGQDPAAGVEEDEDGPDDQDSHQHLKQYWS